MKTYRSWGCVTGVLLCLWMLGCGDSALPPGSVPLGGACTYNADCGPALLCMDQKCAALGSVQTCTPGKTRCNGSEVEVCGADGRSYEFKESCAGRCGNGACVAQACAPNTTRCQADNKTVEACLPDGSGYAVVQTCATSCAGGTCATAGAAICVPGRTKCNGTDIEECRPDGSGYTYLQSCTTTCSNGACIGAACKPFTLKASSPSLPADNISTVLIFSDTITNSDGVPVPDGTLFTVAASDNTGGVQSTDLDTTTAGVQVASVNGKIDFLVKASPAANAGQQATATATTLAASNCMGTANFQLATVGTNLQVAEDFTRALYKDANNTSAAWDLESAQTAFPLVAGLGNGEDGDLYVAVSGTFNINTQSNPANPSRTFPDAVAYKVSAFSTDNTAVTLANFPAGLAVGDEVVLINLQGGSNFPSPTATQSPGVGNTGNVGNYEILTVRAVNFGTNQLIFASPIRKIYGATNSNATLTGQKIIVQRIPRYRNVTVSGTLTANAWDGATGGILFIKASESLVVTSGAVVLMRGKGYRVDSGAGDGNRAGESYSGTGGRNSYCSNNGGGGASGNGSSGCDGGGGGSYGTAGTPSGSSMAAGFTYGEEMLNRWFMGSAGGQFSAVTTVNAGGGIIVLWASTLGVSGSIYNDGLGSYSGGSAGGSIYLRANTMNVGQGRVSARGDANANGGFGGAGRIRLDAASLHAGDTTNPPFVAGVSTSGTVKAQTLALDSVSGAITQARVISALQDTRGGSIVYELSSNGGTNWKAFTPGAPLQSFDVAASDLRLRITLTSDGSNRPLGVQGVSIEYLAP